MTFPSNVYLTAFLSALATAAVTLPLWRKWSFRVGLVDDPGHRKIHHEPIALAGGLAVMTALLLPTLVGALVIGLQNAGANAGDLDATHNAATGSGLRFLPPHSVYLLKYGLEKRALELTGILAGAVGMLLLGLLDDKRELRPGVKFFGQLLIAAIVAASGARITLFVPNILFSYAITILWILTVTNAVNFMDNMNGLCAGLAAIASGCFAAIAAAQGQYLVAMIGFLACGALLGFLPWNFPRARAFLGDSGSHLAGYLLAVLAILPHFYTARHPRRWAVMIPLFVLAVPLLDLVWVVWIRWRIGQPFYHGDTNHLSHRLVRAGLSQTRAVLLIWLLAALIGSVVWLF